MPGIDVTLMVSSNIGTPPSGAGFGEGGRVRVSGEPEPAAMGPVALPTRGTVQEPLFGPSQRTFTILTLTEITVFVPVGPRETRGGPPMVGTGKAWNIGDLGATVASGVGGVVGGGVTAVLC